MYSLILRGRRLIEFQKWGHLRFASPNVLSTLSSSFSSASPADGRKRNNFTVAYLVDSLGFTTKLAESILRKVTSEAKGDPDSVLNLLKSHGFRDSHISTIISNYPRLLLLDAEKSLAPNLKFLHSRGASTSELTEILSKVPKILGMKGDKAVGRYYDFVKDIIEADKSSNYEMSCLSALPEGSRQENIIRNVLVLRRLGVPQKLLFSLLISCSHIVSGKDRFEESLKKVVEMGFDPRTSKFVEALRIVYQMSDKTVEDKVNLYKRLGFAVEDVWEMFKKYPFLLAISEKNILNSFETFMRLAFTRDEFVRMMFRKYPFSLAYSERKIINIFETFLGLGVTRDEFATMIMSSPQCIGFSAEALKRKTEFLVKKMNWPLKALVSRPQVYNYSMEKMIVPRSNVIGALMSRRLLRDGVSEIPPPLPSVFACTDQAFLNRYVLKVDDKELVAELMAIFNADRAS
ncbi:unnamed protein product [Brassica rapa]|uniref:Mitochondrial transcription termination factor family protein n=1 Tax=Brassica campestris TaxID=3711 RepID=A0A3P5ZW45_BRACM|nr:unnamed protein product [Brassica rapa]VDC76710.1 unnamed protein product [Brassica rapa]